MPVYLLHGFRWPRPLVRIHIILQNLDDAAAEWLIAPPTTRALLSNFHQLYPDTMAALPTLRFYEQYDPHDISDSGKSQPYAYVADIAEEIKLGAEVDAIRGKGVSNEQWASLMELRDKLAPDEKVSWYIVVCGDEERWAPSTVDLLENGVASAMGNGMASSPGENGYGYQSRERSTTGSSVSRDQRNGGRDRSNSTRDNGTAMSMTSVESALTESLYDLEEEEEEDEGEQKATAIIMHTPRRSVSDAYHLSPYSAGESAEIGYAGHAGRKRGERVEKVLLHEKRLEREEKYEGFAKNNLKKQIPYRSSRANAPTKHTTRSTMTALA
ncbi:MAG: hypothetical protein M1822_009027 [Bathelium mastoideum]|nr:MAG: hypothetical protein M1822_009027 [Bathelium mastoideum]